MSPFTRLGLSLRELIQEEVAQHHLLAKVVMVELVRLPALQGDMELEVEVEVGRRQAVMAAMVTFLSNGFQTKEDT